MNNSELNQKIRELEDLREHTLRGIVDGDLRYNVVLLIDDALRSSWETLRENNQVIERHTARFNKLVTLHSRVTKLVGDKLDSSENDSLFGKYDNFVTSLESEVNQLGRDISRIRGN